MKEGAGYEILIRSPLSFKIVHFHANIDHFGLFVCMFVEKNLLKVRVQTSKFNKVFILSKVCRQIYF